LITSLHIAAAKQLTRKKRRNAQDEVDAAAAQVDKKERLCGSECRTSLNTL
jgi:hypothetical protein